jgi:hypothetical protein
MSWLGEDLAWLLVRMRKGTDQGQMKDLPISGTQFVSPGGQGLCLYPFILSASSLEINIQEGLKTFLPNTCLPVTVI